MLAGNSAPSWFKIHTAFTNSSHIVTKVARPWEGQCTEVVEGTVLWVNLVLKTNCKQLVSFSADTFIASEWGFLHWWSQISVTTLHSAQSTVTVFGFSTKQTYSPQSPNTFHYKHSHQFSCTNSLGPNLILHDIKQFFFTCHLWRKILSWNFCSRLTNCQTT